MLCGCRFELITQRVSHYCRGSISVVMCLLSNFPPFNALWMPILITQEVSHYCQGSISVLMCLFFNFPPFNALWMPI